MTPSLVVIYGPPLAGKTTVANALARLLGGPAVVLSTDAMLEGAIVVPSEDAEAELEMVHTQLRLLVANYLKNGYSAVVEGPFLYERSGVRFSYEADIDQLVALMRNLAAQRLIVQLTAPEAELRGRAASSVRENELATALSLSAGYKARYGDRFRAFDTSSATVEWIVADICEAMGAD